LRKLIDKRRNYWVLIPTYGTLVFIVLYVVATKFYPGGSQVDKNAYGFSWMNNYWCNLLNENAMNGEYNTAKPIAMAAMLVLCLSLALFWFLFPRQLDIRKGLKLTIQISGILSMSIAYFLFTTYNHDLITNLASFFGLLAIIGTFIGLYKAKRYAHLVFGLLNILLIGVNTYFYYNKELIIYLPVIQKISFATFLTWICCLNILLLRITKRQAIT